MKKQIFKFLTTVLFIFFVLTGFGQNIQPKMESIKKGTENTKATLHLTDEQAIQYELVNRKFIADMNIIEQSSDNMLVKSQKKKDLFKWRENELRKIFTTDQYQQYVEANNAKRSE